MIYFRKLSLSALAGLLLLAPAVGPQAMDITAAKDRPPSPPKPITLFLTGDVMTGRGIDQVLPHPGDPILYEPAMQSALGYVSLAEEANGPIPRPASFSYIWGDAIEELERRKPDLRIINLETSLTESGEPWPAKPVLYKMHPDNVPVLTAAGIDFCSLANNHTLDWGYSGLTETLETLKKADIKTSGAGRNLKEAQAPAVLDVKSKGRVIIFSYGSVTSGILPGWAASEDRAGVNLLRSYSEAAVRDIKKKIEDIKHDGDIVVVSIHWGGNWGYSVPREHRKFAHKLIDVAGVDVVHGHSSHHAMGIEVYRGKLVLYGSGDFINDYEGIGGYESYRSDLSLMYFAAVDPATGDLVSLEMTPNRMRNFKVNRASKEDSEWLRDNLSREGKKLGTSVELKSDNTLTLRWN